MESLIAPLVNVTILIVFLSTKLKLPIRSFVSQRHLSIRDEIHSVREQLRQAQEQYDEFSFKLKAVDAEIAVLREQTKQDSVAIRQKVVNEARRVSGSIVSDAKNTAETMFSDLKGQLYFELVNKALEQAESLLRERLTGDDRMRIRQEFSRQMESIQ
jgi:F0F1-type ATP synthase membrane subunit b/b'